LHALISSTHLFPGSLVGRVVLDYTGQLRLEEALAHSMLLRGKVMVEISHELVKRVVCLHHVGKNEGMRSVGYTK
jgi:hypothetical protein